MTLESHSRSTMDGAIASKSENLQLADDQTTATRLQTVLETVELLERILFHVEWKQTFAMQRVCRYFRDVIAKSAMLQQKMLLMPCKVYGKNVPLTEDLGYNSSWTKSFTDKSLAGEAEWRWRCPLVIPRGARLGYARKPNVQSYFYGLDIPMPAAVDKGESWRKVFLCDPPVQEVYISLVYHGPHALYQYIGRIVNKNGLTVGDLIPLEINFGGKVKGLAESFGAWGDPVKDLEGIPVEPPSVQVFQEEGVKVVVDFARTKFVLYTKHMSKMGMDFVNLH